MPDPEGDYSRLRPPPLSPLVLLALFFCFHAGPFCPDVRGVMDGITTGTRPGSRDWPSSSVLLACRELFPYTAERIRTIQWTRRLENKYNNNKRENEGALPCPSLLCTMVRLLSTLLFPPLSNLSNPCLQLSGPRFMEELRAAVRPLLSPVSVNKFSNPPFSQASL